jgi:heme exporter protein D
MIPDLGRYAAEVALAYGLSLGLIAALILWIRVRGRKIKTALDIIEARRKETR